MISTVVDFFEESTMDELKMSTKKMDLFLKKNKQQSSRSNLFENKETEQICSDKVGILHLTLPEGKKVKKAGDRISKGEVFCYIEALQIMNEVYSPYDGIVQEILVENQAIVDYQCPIFSLKKIG